MTWPRCFPPPVSEHGPRHSPWSLLRRTMIDWGVWYAFAYGMSAVLPEAVGRAGRAVGVGS